MIIFPMQKIILGDDFMFWSDACPQHCQNSQEINLYDFYGNNN